MVDLPKTIDSINKEISPYLNLHERILLKKINLVIDSTNTSYFVASSSDNRMVTISKGAIAEIVKHSIAQLISLGLSSCNRSHFDRFYNNVYPYLAPEIYPEQAALLDEQSIKELNSIISKNLAYGINIKLRFIYLHELKHQFQNVSAKLRGIYKMKQRYDSSEIETLKLKLEYQADDFAETINIYQGMHPLIGLEILSHTTLVREVAFEQLNSINKRSQNLVIFCRKFYKCSKHSSSDCNEIFKAQLLIDSLNNFFEGRYNHIEDYEFLSVEKNSFCINKAYVKGKIFFTGSHEKLQNLDSALYYFSIVATYPYEKNNLYGENSEWSLNHKKEYCSLLVGEIYEHKFHDSKQAIYFYTKAMDISSYLPSNYYQNLISKLSNYNH